MAAVLTHARRTLRVTFQGHTVAVRSDAPEVLAGLERSFGAMLAPAPMAADGQLEVSRRGRSYQASGHRGVDVPDGSLADVLRWLRFSIVQILMNAQPRLLWLHAGAVAAHDRALLLPGARGHGKSTLVTRLCARGWSYLSDDVVPLHTTSDLVLPFPVTPARREFPGRLMTSEWVRASSKVEVAITSGHLCRRPVVAGAVVFPTYCDGVAADLSPCPPAQAVVELLPHCWNQPGTGSAGLVRELCGLADRLPAFRLAFSDPDRATDLLMRSRLLAPPAPPAPDDADTP